jgi:adenosine kinase
MSVLLTGSIAYDYLMRFPGRFVDHIITEDLHQVSLSFLVDEMTRHWGGVAANISFSMAMLGLRPQLFGAVGRDFGEYRMWLEKNGVDCSTVKQIDEVFTASFFANTDLDNNQIASFYAGAMGLSHKFSIADVTDAKPEWVVVSPNDPSAMSKLTQECRDRGIRFIYDPSQQVPRLSGEELAHDMTGAYAMVINAYEASIISKKTGLSLHDLRERIPVLVITQGKHGSVIYEGKTEHIVPAFPEVHIADPTGVGDAFRAGLIRGIMGGWPLPLAGLVGALCATYVLEQVGPQSHSFTIPEFIARFRSVYDDGGRLDELLHVNDATS